MFLSTLSALGEIIHRLKLQSQLISKFF